MDFIRAHFGLIIGIIVVAVFAIQAANAIKKAKKIDRDGIETDGIVSRIAEVYDPENLSSSFTTYIKYKDRDGNEIESPAVLSRDVEYAVGDRVRVKYMPGDRKMARIV